MFRKLTLAAAAALTLSTAPVLAEPTSLLNVSYDIARELYVDLNEAFRARHQKETGVAVTIDQSHGGSSRQARAILEGLQADVVTFNQVTDVQVLHDRGEMIPTEWQSRLPNNASPYYSLPAFLVRAGNPKTIRDWSDLARDDVSVVFPNPKTSGNGRYTYLAARAWAQEAFAGDEAKVTAYLTKVFSNVPVFDTGGRAATQTFLEREIGDVLITFEAEVLAIAREAGADRVEPAIPSLSLLAEFPVSVVDSVVDARGSRALAESYLDFLYTPEAQEILARHGNRVHDAEVSARFAETFPQVRLVTVEDTFGGWERVTSEHFAEGGKLDEVFVNR